MNIENAVYIFKTYSSTSLDLFINELESKECLDAYETEQLHILYLVRELRSFKDMYGNLLQ